MSDATFPPRPPAGLSPPVKLLNTSAIDCPVNAEAIITPPMATRTMATGISGFARAGLWPAAAFFHRGGVRRVTDSLFRFRRREGGWRGVGVLRAVDESGRAFDID